MLHKRLKEGIMFGHQDDLAYGIGWYKVPGKSDVKEVSGKYPAVFGWELGALERNSPYNLDSVYFSDLTDKEGKPIPVLFRPFHEHSGNWFWWCAEQCTPEEYIRLWQMTFNYLTETKQIHQLIWTYSPAASPVSSEDDYLARYPGDEYVDMLGFDSYMNTSDPDNAANVYINELDRNLLIITDLSKKRNKIPALTETGLEAIPVENYFTGILWSTISKYEISYFLVWRNAINRPDHFYAPHPGHSSCEDFNKMVKDKRLIMITPERGL